MNTDEKIKEFAEMVRVACEQANSATAAALYHIRDEAIEMLCEQPAPPPEPFPVGTAVVADDGVVRMETGVVVGRLKNTALYKSPKPKCYLVFDSALMDSKDGVHGGGDSLFEQGGPVPGVRTGHRWYGHRHLRRR